MSAGNMTGAHDLQLAPACQPLSQATGTNTVFGHYKDSYMYSASVNLMFYKVSESLCRHHVLCLLA